MCLSHAPNTHESSTIAEQKNKINSETFNIRMSLKCVCNLHDKFRVRVSTSFCSGLIPLQEKNEEKKGRQFHRCDSSLFSLPTPLSLSRCAFELKSFAETTIMWIKRANSTFASVYLSGSNQYFCSLSLERSGNALWNFLDMMMLSLYSCLNVTRATSGLMRSSAQCSFLLVEYLPSSHVRFFVRFLDVSKQNNIRFYLPPSLPLASSVFHLMILSVFISSFLLWVRRQFSRYFPFKCWIAVDFNSGTRVSAIFTSCFVEHNSLAQSSSLAHTHTHTSGVYGWFQSIKMCTPTSLIDFTT